VQTTKDDSGAAAVEMALVLPILLLLVFGIVDFGRAYNAQLTLTHAARESVRVWALGGPNKDTYEGVAVAAATSLKNVKATSTGCTPGHATSVTVTAPFTFITPFIADLAPGLSSLSAEGVMRCGG